MPGRVTTRIKLQSGGFFEASHANHLRLMARVEDEAENSGGRVEAGKLFGGDRMVVITSSPGTSMRRVIRVLTFMESSSPLTNTPGHVSTKFSAAWVAAPQSFLATAGLDFTDTTEDERRWVIGEVACLVE